MTRMVRVVNTSSRLDVIHMRSCHMARRGGAQEWPAGDSNTSDQLSLASTQHRFRPCRVCKPFPSPPLQVWRRVDQLARARKGAR